MKQKLSKLKIEILNQIEKGCIEIESGIEYFQEKTTYYFNISEYHKIALYFELDDIRHSNAIVINPIIGFLNVKSEHLYEQLMSFIDSRKIFRCTTYKSLGYFMPDNVFKTWEIGFDSNCANIINNLFFCIKTYAFPDLIKYLDSSLLIEDMKNEVIGIYKMNQYKIPSILISEGEYDLALKYSSRVLNDSLPKSKDENLRGKIIKCNDLNEANEIFYPGKDIIFYFNYYKLYENINDYINKKPNSNRDY